MIFARESGPPRTARSRRALPSRRLWPYVVAILAIVAIAAGSAVWVMRDGRPRLPPFLESFRKTFRMPSAISPSSKAVLEKGPSHSKTSVSGKIGAQKKKSPGKDKSGGAEKVASVESLRAGNADILEELRAMAPTGYYVVINTAGNRVTLHNGDKIEAEMIASCGSGNVLEDPKGGRRWTFDTPRGVFTVKSKVADPVWIKPDWAFIEEGEPIPRNRADRAEPGMMGDFAIGIGDGYYLHGTLYKRLLGRNVSHGCVRLGDADIERLYRTLTKGDRVYIF